MKKFGLAVLASTLFLASPLQVMAQEPVTVESEQEDREGSRMPELPESPYNITISFGVDDNQGRYVGIEGATYSIYKVADLKVNGGSADYTVVEPYTKLASYNDSKQDVTFDGMSETESLRFAKKAVEIENTAVFTGTTDSNGKIYFTLNEPAMYMFVETGRTSSASNYELATPFIISVPNAQNGNWEDSLVVSPKTDIVKVQVKNVKTGLMDAVDYRVFIGGGVALLAIALFFASRYLKRNA